MIRRYLPKVVGQEDAWDKFVKTYAASRWVVVRLNSGDTYAGMLQQADIARDPDFRDIVIEEPAVFDERTKNYIATSYKFIYIRGDQLLFIAGLTKNDEIAERLTEIGQPIFPQGEDDEREET